MYAMVYMEVAVTRMFWVLSRHETCLVEEAVPALIR